MAACHQSNATEKESLPESGAEVIDAQTNIYLARVMANGTWEDIKTVIKYFGAPFFRGVLNDAPRHIFDRQSWAYWHSFFGLDVPFKPDFFFTSYPWFDRRGAAKSAAVTAEKINFQGLFCLSTAGT